MEYRILPHGGEKIGVIGMGSSVVGAQKEADIIRTVRTAFDLGVNYFDMAGGHASIFPAYGKALKDIRRQVFLQVHFGADYTRANTAGPPSWTKSSAPSPGSWKTCRRTTSTSASSTVWMKKPTCAHMRKTAFCAICRTCSGRVSCAISVFPRTHRVLQTACWTCASSTC